MDRNDGGKASGKFFIESLSARRAWIEILTTGRGLPGCGVALRKESVDRNNRKCRGTNPNRVALRKESVDRNTFSIVTPHHPQLVALRKESVDRNRNNDSRCTIYKVALRKESVDRNSYQQYASFYKQGRSPQGERG